MGWNIYGNATRGAALKVACDANGLVFTIWMTRSGQPENDFDFSPETARQACIESGAAGFIAEAEIPAYANGQPNPQAQNWPALVFMLSDLPIFKAVATSWSPFTNAQGLPDASKAKALIQGGWSCLPYVYPGEHAGITIEQQAQYAKHYTHEAAKTVLAPGEGWYSVQPVLGCYGGFTLADFPTRGNYRNWSTWDAGSVL